MGNSLIGVRKTAKVMKIDGETFKLKAPVKAGEVLKHHPGLVLLESEAVKHYGIRAKPLEPHKELQPKRLYFLVELPKETTTVPRRVHSGITMSAKDRLESLVLSRRSVSELSIMKQSNTMQGKEQSGDGVGGVRLKMRLPKAEVEKLIRESKDESEAAEKIMGLCMAAKKSNREKKHEIEEEDEKMMMMVVEKQMHWNNSKGNTVREGTKAREKRVSFMPISEGGTQIAVAS